MGHARNWGPKKDWEACGRFVEAEEGRFELALKVFLEANPDWYGQAYGSRYSYTSFKVLLGIRLSARPKRKAWKHVDWLPDREETDLCHMDEEEVDKGALFVAGLLNGSNLKVSRETTDEKSSFYLGYEVKIKDYTPFLA